MSTNPTPWPDTVSDASGLLLAGLTEDHTMVATLAATLDRDALEIMLADVVNLAARALVADQEEWHAYGLQEAVPEATPGIALLVATAAHSRRSTGVSDDQGGESE